MKKNNITSHIIALTMALILVGCSASNEETIVPQPEPSNTALSFTAYVSRNSRVADEHAIDDVNALAQVGGFGVFGYLQGTRNFDSYTLDASIPNFFVNQQVWDSSQDTQPGHKGADAIASGEWKYEPVRYFDNNDGAKHSFFAYAPYTPNAKMTYLNGRAPLLQYDIKDDIDILWAEPTKDMQKPAVGTQVTFNFAHALTKATFNVVPFFDMAHAGDNHSLTGNTIPEGTTVRVRSIHLNGVIPYTGLLNTETGKWTADKKGQYFDVPNANTATWTGGAGGTLVESRSEIGSSKLIPATDLTIEVIYDVITGTGDDKSYITNKAVSTQTFNLDQGKAYTFNLDLGLTSVKFTATVVDWTIEKHPEYEMVMIETVTATLVPWVDLDGSGLDIDLEGISQ